MAMEASSPATIHDRKPDAVARSAQILNGVHGLRAIAAISVLLFHQSYNLELPSFAQWVRNYGGQGVALFFVLSAFSLAYSTTPRIGQKDWVWAYIVKRYFRIAPFFYVMIAFFIVHDYFVWNKSLLLGELILNLAMVHNFVPVKHESMVWAGWTIGVEVIFYAVLPLLLVTIGSLRAAAGLFVAACLIRVAAVTSLSETPGIPPNFPAMSFLAALPAFAAGLFSYWIFKRIELQRADPLKAVGCCIAVVAAAVVSIGMRPLPHVYYISWIIAFAALTVWQAYRPDSVIGSTWMRFIGERSYSIYLTHAPIVTYLKPVYGAIYFAAGPGASSIAYLVCAALGIAAVLLVSSITYRFIEEPCIRFGERVIRRRRDMNGGGSLLPSPLSSWQWLLSYGTPGGLSSWREAFQHWTRFLIPYSMRIRFQIIVAKAWLSQHLEHVLFWAIGTAVLHALLVLLIGLDRPLLDQHSFRQAQTALTAYWLLKGGPWLAYETPVVGAPWSIPFEFPVYQLIVGALGYTGIPLNAAGRLVSFGFFLGCLLPIRMIYEHFKVDRTSYLCTSLLFLAAPLYLYWGRAFLVETCALFFALLWFALLARTTANPNLQTAGSTALAGTLAVLAKATTFPGYALIGAMLAVAAFANRFRKLERWELSRNDLMRYVIYLGLAFAVPFILGFAWVAYTDAVKGQNEFGRLLSSDSLSRWNFGTLEQKSSAQLWLGIVHGRIATDSVGWFSLIGYATILAAAVRWRFLPAVALSLLAFFVPIAVFTNLHIVHNYYQVANAVCLIAAVGISLGALIAQNRHLFAFGALAVLVLGQVGHFQRAFMHELTKPYQDDPVWQISQIARERTRPNESLIVLGDDWSSVVPYHSQRKSLTIASWFPGPLVERVFARPEDFLGGVALGGIVVCKDGLRSYVALSEPIRSFTAGRAEIGSVGGCSLLSPQRQ